MSQLTSTNQNESVSRKKLNLRLPQPHHDIAYKTGQIQGTAQGIIIIKDMSRKDMESSLRFIIRLAKQINARNKEILKSSNKYTRMSSEKKN